MNKEWFHCEECKDVTIASYGSCRGCGVVMIDKVEIDIVKDKKYDSGKPMVGLMKKDFSKALEAVAVVTTYGVEKYKAPGSWRKVTDAMSRYEDALGRHDLLAFEEPYDDESHLLHVAHRAWNALAILEMVLEELEVKE